MAFKASSPTYPTPTPHTPGKSTTFSHFPVPFTPRVGGHPAITATPQGQSGPPRTPTKPSVPPHHLTLPPPPISLQCKPEAMKGKAAVRRYPYRTVLNLVAGIVLTLLFVRTLFLAFQAAAICPPISCFGWRIPPRFFSRGAEAYPFQKELGKEVRRAFLLEMNEGGMDLEGVEDGPDSLKDLMKEMDHYDRFDMKDFVLKSKAMLMKMERNIQSAKLQASIFKYLASVEIPKTIHCLTLKLAEEYSINNLARSSLPPPEYAFLLTNPSHIHIALLTDNVLAAAVTVSSTLTSSTNPDKLVFHIITDKKTCSAMHAWFALHPVFPAIVEVKGLNQFDWPTHTSAMIMNTVEEIPRGSLDHHKFSRISDDGYRGPEALKPSSFSLLNYLRIHLPEFFPKLERVILLDDDVVVQRDLTPLWSLDLNGNVNGAVRLGVGDEAGKCTGMKFRDYMNFSDPQISSPSLGLETDQCAWYSGVNIFDLKAWGRTNITQTYQQWLKQNRASGFQLLHLGWLPPALIAFDGYVHPIDPSWHLTGLGVRMPEPEQLESAAVLHFSGPGKPWLEIGFPGLREIWQGHVNRSNEFIRSCAIAEYEDNRILLEKPSA